MFENNYRFLLRVGQKILERCPIVDSEKLIAHVFIAFLLKAGLIIQDSDNSY